MTRTEMEDRIKLRSWGLWAKPDFDRMLGAKAPGWAALVKAGYRESPKDPIPPITDDEALDIDMAIAALVEDWTNIIIAHYVYRLSMRAMSRYFDRSRRQINNTLDDAVEAVYRDIFPGDWLNLQAEKKYSATS